MKVLSINNNDNYSIGYLFYYETTKSFYIELKENLNEWDVPLLLSSFVSRKKYSLDSYWSKIWVKERIIPSDRQNIGQILRDNRIKEYDEYPMLLLTNGRCSQDDFYVKEINYESIPKQITKRFSQKLDDVILSNQNLICFFRNGETKKVSLVQFIDEVDHLEGILNNENVLKRMEMQADGYGVEWNESVFISTYDLYSKGNKIDISIDDFKNFVDSRIINTNEACQILECSRQNINDLMKKNKLHPIRKDEKNTFFYKSEIIRRKRNK